MVDENGLMDDGWSGGVVECWSVGGMSSGSIREPITAPLQYSNTPFGLGVTPTLNTAFRLALRATHSLA